jgi:hypothetical protein
MLVRNAPVTIDFAQTQSEPEKKTVLVHRVAGRIGSTPHDGYCEGDLCARSNGEFSEVKGCAGFVVAKKQVPRLGVRFNASAFEVAAADRTSPFLDHDAQGSPEDRDGGQRLSSPQAGL